MKGKFPGGFWEKKGFSLFWEPLKENTSLPLDVGWGQGWVQMQGLEPAQPSEERLPAEE